MFQQGILILHSCKQLSEVFIFIKDKYLNNWVSADLCLLALQYSCIRILYFFAHLFYYYSEDFYIFK